MGARLPQFIAEQSSCTSDTVAEREGEGEAWPHVRIYGIFGKETSFWLHEKRRLCRHGGSFTVEMFFLGQRLIFFFLRFCQPRCCKAGLEEGNEVDVDKIMK